HAVDQTVGSDDVVHAAFGCDHGRVIADADCDVRRARVGASTKTLDQLAFAERAYGGHEVHKKPRFAVWGGRMNLQSRWIHWSIRASGFPTTEACTPRGIAAHFVVKHRLKRHSKPSPTKQGVEAIAPSRRVSRRQDESESLERAT